MTALGTNRRWSRVALLAAVALAALVGVTALSAPAMAQENVTTGTNATVPSEVVESDEPDPASDRLGWENGVWHNATLSVTQSDGITRAELRAVVARTMARVEYVRGIEFDRTPPVRLITRDQQTSEVASLTDLDATDRTLLNQQYEALFLINETTDAVEAQEALLGGGVGGYYAPGTRNVTLVSPPGDVLRLTEGTLAQELFHAQQDQQFDLRTNVTTIEERNTRNVVVEGDANYVQYRYQQRCGDVWTGTCYTPRGNATSGVERPPNLNIGMTQLFLQPYNSGVAFVRDRHRSDGWDAVNALYERTPDSTEQSIHPEAYPDDAPTNLTVPDRSADGWKPLTDNGTQAFSSVGEPGLFVALWYPGFQTRGVSTIIPLRAHYNLNESGGLQRPVTYTYSHPATTGWDGDRLVPYVPTDGTNRTGYVYETAWDSAADAREFADSYRELLSYHDARPLDGDDTAYRLPEESGFGDVIVIDRDGDRLTIVNAPTVEALTAIRPDAAPAVENGTASGTTTAGETTETGASGPGFGPAVTAVALLAVALLARRLR